MFCEVRICEQEITLTRSDQELVTAACDGDVEVFGMLYERHYKMVVAIAYNQLLDRHLAEDAAQEAFAVACRQLTTLKDGIRFAQWIGTICRRIAAKMAHKRTDAVDFQTEVADDSAAYLEDHSQVREAIGRLSASQREVIFLRYYSELSYDQIAEVTDSTQQSVHGLLQRARRSLAKELGKTTNR
jgi:RNA polymerase sigma-70 factor (ECF subfamily)